MQLHPDLKRHGIKISDWLGDAAAGVMITFDIDAETNLLSKADAYRDYLTPMSHHQYGPRIAVPRILEMLERQEVPATFFVPGLTAERWPETVSSIVDAGHEVGLHGYMHYSPTHLSHEGEREEIDKALSALGQIGVSPVGCRVPVWAPTIWTYQLLLEYGMKYDTSLMDDDRPYLLETPWGRLAELPPHWMLDDWEQYAYLAEPFIGSNIESTRKVFEIWADELDAMRRTHSLLILTLHPLISGRPSRLAVVERLIEFAKDCGDVAFLRCDAVAEKVFAAERLAYAGI
jgi:peptidoglycan-N-acetylglucosamine deacetylase